MRKKELSEEEVLHLAELAKLQLTDKEIEDLQKKLSETLDYVENLNELDTKNTEPTNQTTQLTDVFYKDGEENPRGLTQEEATKNAKSTKEGYFIVKRIM